MKVVIGSIRSSGTVDLLAECEVFMDFALDMRLEDCHLELPLLLFVVITDNVLMDEDMS